ncbi:MAG TPA: DUF6328 family protein [Actinomycetota bacterium]|nr:DUF6328 family protein [Actinomycetota bacterium]
MSDERERDGEPQRSGQQQAGDGSDGEDQRERVNRELIELLNELRVALPGVQVLFAFLLILPFNPGFSRITSTERYVYFGSFIAAAIATALLIAPSSYHRIRFRAHDKEQMLFTSNRLAIVGMAFLALSISGVVFLITDFLFGEPTAAVITAAIAAWFAWLWYGLPLSRKLKDHADEEKAQRS